MVGCTILALKYLAIAACKSSYPSSEWQPQGSSAWVWMSIARTLEMSTMSVSLLFLRSKPAVSGSDPDHAPDLRCRKAASSRSPRRVRTLRNVERCPWRSSRRRPWRPVRSQDKRPGNPASNCPRTRVATFGQARGGFLTGQKVADRSLRRRTSVRSKPCRDPARPYRGMIMTSDLVVAVMRR